MKKLIFLAAIAAFMLHGCADEPIAEPIDENNVETRASGNDITIVSPTGLYLSDYQNDYLLTGVEYRFSSPYSIYGNPLQNYNFYVRWKIGDAWELADYLPSPYDWYGQFVHTFDTPGTYTVRSGKFSENQWVGSPPMEEQVRTFTVVDSFVAVSLNGNYMFPLRPDREYKFKATTVAPTGYSATWEVTNSNGNVYPITITGANTMSVTFPTDGIYTIKAKFGPYIEGSMLVIIFHSKIIGPVKP